MVETTTLLTSSLEDYLEVIAELAETEKEVRGSMIADRLGVKRPSVTYAIHLLSEKGFVEYAPYGPVYLTEAGKKEAAEVRRRHAALRIFLSGILGVEENKAADFACKIEHVIDDEITSRLVEFLDFIEHCPSLSQGFLQPSSLPCELSGGECSCSLDRHPHVKTPLTEEIYPLKVPTTTLDEIDVGQRCIIVQIHGNERRRHLLTEMGFTRNTAVQVIRIAPLGDPAEVEVRGTRLSLSKKDAVNIEVIPCKN